MFWHGAYGDGELDWHALLPDLREQFTCHLPSWRGRGLSDYHADLSYGRRVDDVLAYVNSLGGPTGLVGWSGGASPAVAAAAQTDRLFGVALFEPTMGSVMAAHERVEFGEAVARLRERANEGEFADALKAAASFPMNDEEFAVAEEVGYFEAAGPYVPNLLSAFQKLAEYRGPIADDPEVLAAVKVPVLVLHGSETKPLWVRSAQHVAKHIPDSRIQHISGAGHFAPLTHPGSVAAALTDFFLPLSKDAT